jgi:hypothetical protein
MKCYICVVEVSCDNRRTWQGWTVTVYAGRRDEAEAAAIDVVKVAQDAGAWLWHRNVLSVDCA